MEVTNTFKGLYLLDRVPEELWMEIQNTVQEVGTETIPKEKKRKKAKWLSEEALPIVEERREAKGKGERGRDVQRNAEFQKIARREKEAFLNEQHKERKTTERERLEISSRKLRYQGNISCKDGHNKGQKW